MKKELGYYFIYKSIGLYVYSNPGVTYNVSKSEIIEVMDRVKEVSTYNIFLTASLKAIIARVLLAKKIVPIMLKRPKMVYQLIMMLVRMVIRKLFCLKI